MHLLWFEIRHSVCTWKHGSLFFFKLLNDSENLMKNSCNLLPEQERRLSQVLNDKCDVNSLEWLGPGLQNFQNLWGIFLFLQMFDPLCLDNKQFKGPVCAI